MLVSPALAAAPLNAQDTHRETIDKGSASLLCKDIYIGCLRGLPGFSTNCPLPYLRLSYMARRRKRHIAKRTENRWATVRYRGGKQSKHGA
jgi:hypothetical protein